MCFLRFLAEAKSTLSRHLAGSSIGFWAPVRPEPGRKLHLVVGNESCDLDSAVSAVALAFVYAHRNRHHDYIPVLNILRRDYPLKTEVGYMFGKCGIDEQVLLFSDDLPTEMIRNFNVILVDHHVSPLAPSVTEILDHRRLDAEDPSYKLIPAGFQKRIDVSVGSCATLVAERYFFETEPRSTYVAQLLHATIVLDTINFSVASKRFGPLDLNMAEALEEELGLPESVRSQLFDELVAARADISQLSLTEVLRKDMKMLATDRHVVPMAGMPMLVRDFVEKNGAEAAIREFSPGSDVIAILGMYVNPTDGQVQRDLALISLTGQSQLVERIQQALFASSDPDLQLLAHDTRFMGGCFLRQQNVQATRKHILPIVKQALLDWEAEQGCDCEAVTYFKEKPQLGLS
ncbi:hypothetical protein KR018_011790 [Drosophila ironensis]|nr:hypothetical protein KR018_011790 [Drosophila ironensis]